MDYFSKLQRQIRNYVLFFFIFLIIVNYAFWWLITEYYVLPKPLVLATASIINITLVYFVATKISDYITSPIKLLEQVILHVSPTQHGVTAPNLDKARLGKELISSLSMQIYQIASVIDSQKTPPHKDSDETYSKSVLDSIPVPLITIDRHQVIKYANPITATYLGLSESEIVGKDFYSVFNLSFHSDDTLDSWLSDNRKHKLTSSKMWDRVRLILPDQKTRRQLDLIAYFNKGSSNNIETILTIIDKTKTYNNEDDGLGFIALAVHELRTPLTMLRGYIEVFEEELDGKISNELKDYIQKMNVSAQQLADFVGNILNVARVEENQLFLQLHEEDWPTILEEVSKDMKLRAKVNNKHITFEVDDSLPKVAVDKISIYEVINNLLDNAIKYSDKSSEIIVRSIKRDDGLVETTVQDFGIGIPTSVIGNLFEKFYRNHRSRAQIGGTGLGLYLSKAIISAHGGQIWVQSKEGRGSTFGFTLIPYDQLADKQKNEHNKDITRTAHGWIKNHSFYRSQ